jgi:hypothetical protein
MPTLGVQRTHVHAVHHVDATCSPPIKTDTRRPVLDSRVEAMRSAFHARLDALSANLSQMCALAGLAMERATHALLQADLLLAERVIGDHDHLTGMQAEATSFRPARPASTGRR